MSRVGVGTSMALDVEVAAREAVTAAGHELGKGPADLAFLFLSPHHLPDGVEVAVTAVMEGLRPGRLVGCVAQGIIGGEREVESGPGLTVWAASLPGATVTPFRIAGAEEGGEILVPDLGEPALDHPPRRPVRRVAERRPRRAGRRVPGDARGRGNRDRRRPARPAGHDPRPDDLAAGCRRRRARRRSRRGSRLAGLLAARPGVRDHERRGEHRARARRASGLRAAPRDRRRPRPARARARLARDCWPAS